jgi:hypothetical protein
MFAVKYLIALPGKIFNLDKNINIPENVSLRFQQTKDFVHQSVYSVTNSAQQIGDAWKETTTQATNQAVNTLTTTVGQAKASLEQTLQSAEQVKHTTSAAVQTAISSSVSDLFQQHPKLLRLVQILGWAVNHPIISLVILLFVLALTWSLIKAIGRLVESASLSLLRVPLKLLQASVKLSFLSVAKVGRLTTQKQVNKKNINNILTLLPVKSQELHQDKQQRLVEISKRLEEIQKEQNQLLQEAAEMLTNEKIDLSNITN